LRRTSPELERSHSGLVHRLGKAAYRKVSWVQIPPSPHFMNTDRQHRIYTMSVARVYPLYITKVERKGRTKKEVDEIIRWLTGYSQKEIQDHLKKGTDFETFFAQAPDMNPARSLIKGVICGVRIEEIKEKTMREIRYLDKLIDELAKGKEMEKILRK
jgi:hypothetical protein